MILGPLAGGQHAQTFAVEVGELEAVLRVFPAADDAVERELIVLDAVAVLGELVPSYLWHGQVEGRPAILTTRVAGSPPPPRLDPSAIAAEMGRMLARIHRIAPAGLADVVRAPTAGGTEIHSSAAAAWASKDEEPSVLAHNDYWCGNLLWSGRSVTGVVDWSGAGAAPAGHDLAWCRQDLVLLGSWSAASTLIDSYADAGGAVPEQLAVWDLAAAASAQARVETWAPNYLGIGRADIDGDVLRRRLDAWNSTLL